METPKQRRPNFQPYVPIHRRNQPEPSKSQSPPTPRTREESDVKRRGRGKFRAPTLEDDEKETTEKIAPQVQQVTENTTELEDWEEDWETGENVKIETKTIKKTSNKQTTPVIVNDDELTTVLDCYDFPSSFKTLHLQDIFREYEGMKGGYQIKWMDDTRALIVFEHPQIAKKAYIDLLNNPLVKVRPYKGQIEKGPSGPVPRRPVTTDMVAKRLVHGALGVRTQKTPEQRQAERDIIRAAKEKRLAEKANVALRSQQIADAFNE